MDTRNHQLISNDMRQMIIKALILILVVVIGYFVTFVLFRRTAADSTISQERINQITEERIHPDSP